MRSNSSSNAMRVMMAMLCAATCLVTVRLSGQLPFGQVAVIHTFTGGADGANPATGLIQLPNGNFAGMTKGLRGRSDQPAAVYLMTPGGEVTTTYTFARDGSQGWEPIGLMQSSDGNLYGTADRGGSGYVYSVFRVTPAGVFSLLYTFPAGDGIVGPTSGFVEAPDGNLYATGLGVNGSGCIFRVNLRSQETKLFYSFVPLSGASEPSGGLALGPDGRLYGVTYPGGSFAGGSVYAIDLRGTLTVLAVNQDPLVGGARDRPAVGSDGYLYLTSPEGGSSACTNGCGTIYRVAMSGSSAELLYSFTGRDDGYQPANIVPASDGQFYGSVLGALYQFNPLSRTVLSFPLNMAGTDVLPYLLQSASGVLRGTTRRGPSSSTKGESFALNLSLPAPTPMITGFAPTSGPPGTMVTIWGANFVGLQGVALNGVAAQGQAKAAGFIRFVVPRGATTGPITVTTAAGGSVASAVNFTVQ